MIKKSSSSVDSYNKTKENRGTITVTEAYNKACHFCAYQERTQQEVREKLFNLGLKVDDSEELISRLITENYINEERFAKTFAGGKFRLKKWGRIKIKNELKLKNLSDYCIKKGLAEIEDEQYQDVLNNLILEKRRTIAEKNPFKKNHKIASYLIGKGFEPELVWGNLKQNE